MTAIDFARSRAILVGTSRYTGGLDDMPAALKSLSEMRDTLTGPLCGWPTSRVTVFENKATHAGLDQKIARLIHQTTDVLLFFYVGHGQVLDGEHLGLALTDTHRDSRMRHATSLRFADLRAEMTYRCEARVKIVILDCCFAGLATRNAQGDSLSDQVRLLTRIEGAYTLAAARHWQKARYEVSKTGLTYFTRFFTETVRDGIPGKGAFLTLGDIQERVAHRCRTMPVSDDEPRPEPSTLVVDTAERFPFARNAWEPPDAVEPPAPEVDDVPVAPRPSKGVPRRRLLLAGLGLAGVGVTAWRSPDIWRLVGPVPAPARRWSSAINFKKLRMLAVDHGLVYAVGTAQSDVGGGVVALDAATGARRWAFPTDGTLGSVVMAVGTVYVRNADGDTGYVDALDAITGARKWNFRQEGTSITSLVASDDSLYVTCEKRGKRLYRLRASDAAQQWSVLWPADDGPSLSNGVLFGTTFEPDDKSSVTVADAATGASLWTFRGAQKHTGGLLATDDTLLAYSGGAGNSTLLAIGRTKGEERWRLPLVGDIQPLLRADGVLYLHSANKSYTSGTLYAIDLASGSPRWSSPAGHAGLFRPASVVLHDGVIYGSDAVYSFTPDGTQRWRVLADTVALSRLSLAAGKVIVSRSVGGREPGTTLLAVDASSGDIVWEQPLKDASVDVPTPVVSGPVVYVPDDDTVHAFEL